MGSSLLGIKQRVKGEFLNSLFYNNIDNGAEDRTRTYTGLPPQRPERCASTSFATSAWFLYKSKNLNGFLSSVKIHTR